MIEAVDAPPLHALKPIYTHANAHAHAAMPVLHLKTAPAPVSATMMTT